MNNTLLEGSDKPLIVKHAEDQQKKSRENVIMENDPQRFREYGYEAEVLATNQMINAQKVVRGGYPMNPAHPAFLSGGPGGPGYAYPVKYQQQTAPGVMMEWYGPALNRYETAVPIMPMQEPRYIHQHSVFNQFSMSPSLVSDQGRAVPILRPVPAGYLPYEGGPVQVSVIGLPPESTNQSTYNFFSHYGRVVSVQVNTAPSNNSNNADGHATTVCNGSGIVEFSNIDDVHHAVDQLSGSIIDNCSVPLQVRLK